MHTARTITSSVVTQIRTFIINVHRPTAFSMLRITTFVLIKQLIIIIRISVSRNKKNYSRIKRRAKNTQVNFEYFLMRSSCVIKLTLDYYDNNINNKLISTEVLQVLHTH